MTKECVNLNLVMSISCNFMCQIMNNKNWWYAEAQASYDTNDPRNHRHHRFELWVWWIHLALMWPIYFLMWHWWGKKDYTVTVT